MLSEGVPPLSGITVVDLTQVVAGPFATMLLGDLGADVIKIEAPGRGDISRGNGVEYFDTVNRNKESIAVDLKSDEGRAVVTDLLREADVFVENTKPGRLEAFGLTYETTAAVNPELVHCSITSFGTGSRYERVPAFDMLVQAMSGVMSMTGEADGPPVWSGLLSGDLAAGMYAFGSVLSALYARERGLIEGEHIEVPMLDSTISWLGPRAGHTFDTGEPFPRLGTRHPTAAPAGVFECADGPIMIIATTESLWRDFCAAIDRDDLVDDDRFESRERRIENRDALLSEVEPILAGRPIDEWVAAFHEHEVPAGPIHDTETVWDDEHVRWRGLRRRMEREGRPDAQVIDNPVRYDELSAEPRRPPQELGESTDAVLRRHGYSTGEIERLREGGVVG